MMERYRIYHDDKLSDIINLDEANAHKVRSVLRLGLNDKLNILTADSFAKGEIVFISKSKVSVHILSKREAKKPEYKLTAYQAIAKREYMDMIVEKYAEIGVTKIVPVVSSRSFDKVKDNTLDRYRNIAIGAVLQSEGEFVPAIEKPIDIKNISCDEQVKLLFHERLGEKQLPNELPPSVAFIIGSEGGFTEQEYNILINKGFIPYNLMGRVLKAETASIVFSGAIMMRMNFNVK